MNPYEADPKKIPANDRYTDSPFYGRYHPQATDFKPDPAHCNSSLPESTRYWQAVLEDCDEFVRIYNNEDGGRDVFALGSVVVKSSHLKAVPQGRRAHRDYSFADANEVLATALAKKVMGNIKVPEIYFAGKINDRDVFVQERIPGVGLNVAWQYISQSQKDSFKNQARAVLRCLHTVKPPIVQKVRGYVVSDPDPVDHRGIQTLERDIIFSTSNDDPDMSFMHNDLSLSNIIVKDDVIAGVIDWEMAGFFGWKTAGKVHLQIRTPKKESFAALNLPEERLRDILYWNDLYDSHADDVEFVR